jgi:membrane protein implicated in regulation of membrane protease activity
MCYVISGGIVVAGVAVVFFGIGAYVVFVEQPLGRIAPSWLKTAWKWTKGIAAILLLSVLLAMLVVNIARELCK